MAQDELTIMSDCGKACLTTECNFNWVIDSGASFHATPSQDFFTTYEAANLGIVKMGKNRT